MKIKISYTVDHSEVPGEIAKFLDQSQREMEITNSTLRTLKDKFKNNFDLNNLKSYIEDLQKVRTNLVKVDTIVGDCVDLTSGIGELIEHIDRANDEANEATTPENNVEEAGAKPEDE